MAGRLHVMRRGIPHAIGIDLWPLLDDAPDFLEIIGEIDAALTFGSGESCSDHAIEQRLHIVIETIEIVEDARLDQLVEADLRNDLANLLKRTGAAGKGNEHVAKFDHLGATFRDIRYDM